MQLYISELLTELEMEETVISTGLGIELIGFGRSDYLDQYDLTMKNEAALLARCGNPPLSIHGPFLDLNPMSYDSLILEATKKRFDQSYRAAKTLGANTIVFHSGMIPTVYYTEMWAERMIDFWETFLDGRSGIRVCMENVLDYELEPFAEVADGVTHPDFGICLDLGHVNCYAQDSVFCWAERLAGKIRHIHLHDNDGLKDSHLAVGAGTVPWDEVLPEIISQNPGLTGTIECNTVSDVLDSVRRLKNIAGIT